MHEVIYSLKKFPLTNLFLLFPRFFKDEVFLLECFTWTSIILMKKHFYFIFWLSIFVNNNFCYLNSFMYQFMAKMSKVMPTFTQSTCGICHLQTNECLFSSFAIYIPSASASSSQSRKMNGFMYCVSCVIFVLMLSSAYCLEMHATSQLVSSHLRFHNWNLSTNWDTHDNHIQQQEH